MKNSLVTSFDNSLNLKQLGQVAQLVEQRTEKTSQKRASHVTIAYFIS
jgi:hypothetical protein